MERRNGEGRRAEDQVRLPWMKFYIDDWTTSSKVRAMGPVARAWYHELLIIQWRDGYVNDTSLSLQRLLRQMPRDPDIVAEHVPEEEHDINDYPAILQQVLQCFEPDGPGRLVNRRLKTLRDQEVRVFLAKSSASKDSWTSRQRVKIDSIRDTDTDTDTERSKALSTKNKQAIQIPQTFEPNEANRALATKLGVDLAGEYEAFGDFHRSKGSRFKDWHLALNSWIRNAVRFGRNGNGSTDKGKQARERGVRAVLAENAEEG